MSDFEDRVRRSLRTDVPAVDADQLLVDVHRGASRRRRQRAAATVAASVLVVAGAVGVATQVGGERGARPEPLPTPSESPSPTQPALPDGASQGVVDVSVASSDRWFRLTTNVGCAACSTIWQNEQSAEGGWERLHDFEGTTADYGGPVDARFGPVGHLVMAADAENGWAWGSRLYATHDGGRTWTVVTAGPGQGEGGSLEIGVTDTDVWALRRTRRATVELWRSLPGSDTWERADAPDMGGVTGLVTMAGFVGLEVSDEGLTDPRLRYLSVPWNDLRAWAEVANPCPGENRVYAATSVLFLLCPSGDGATVHRLIGFEHSYRFEWQEFGQSTGTVTNVVPVGDDRLLVVGTRGRATLVTESGSQPVDLGTTAETFESSSNGRLVLLTTSDDTLLESTDGGRTWGPVPE